jgi:hypothetical protein
MASVTAPYWELIQPVENSYIASSVLHWFADLCLQLLLFSLLWFHEGQCYSKVKTSLYITVFGKFLMHTFVLLLKVLCIKLKLTRLRSMRFVDIMVVQVSFIWACWIVYLFLR